MAKQSDFNSFLSNIEPSSSTVDYISSIQNNLRAYLRNHEDYKDVHIDTFLSGSYAKHTSIRPVLGDAKRDVDIIVVTSYTKDKNSADVLTELQNVLLDKDTYNTATIQHHSVGVEMSGISVDVVPVIADEVDEELYYIGDSETGSWTLTDPKGHKSWSTDVNKNNDDKYKPIVKIFKWWRRNNCPEGIKYPKGITLEKIIADNLGDPSLCTENLLISTMQNIIAAYKEDYVDNGVNPTVWDPSKKVSGNDLLSSYSTDDFSAFVDKLVEHTRLLDAEGLTNEIWRQILGKEFPQSSTKASHSSRINLQLFASVPHRQSLMWPMQRGGVAFISAQVTTPSGTAIEYVNNGDPLAKNCSLIFRALTGIKPPYTVKWQIVNSGEEARRANCLRGNFESSDYGLYGKRESTSYSGSHSIQCFIIKKGVCVAKSKEFIINIC